MSYNEGKEPDIQVGIMAESRIVFSLTGPFRYQKQEITGGGVAQISEGALCIEMESGECFAGNELLLQAVTKESRFMLHDVTIGINFHWERKEDQAFAGSLRFQLEGGKVRAVNVVLLEAYLASVISSEMSATSSMELLKAHAVISRGWLLAQIDKKNVLAGTEEEYASFVQTDEERVRWYDREDHSGFDVCADDHCQRYQGVTRMVSENVAKAILSTYGQVLTFEGAICDARFSKSCGGVSELFENCWEPVHHPYLDKVVDNDEVSAGFSLDLTDENAADAWIRHAPPAFCNTHDATVLSQVLNNYDQETADFYRWKVAYSQEEISALLVERTGIDFGKIKALVPVQRGESGRLIRLRIEGTKRTMVIGKELEIRKALSSSHLYSSAFVIDTRYEGNDVPEQFILTGAGWGHGVGLCQIGAAVMGAKGYTYQEILMHYFKNANLERIYHKI